MSPKYQQNLRANLALKLQQAQWAASEEKSALFIQTLNDIQAWLNNYFHLGHLETAQFYQRIELLKSEVISYEYPATLLSIQAIRTLLENKVSLTEDAQKQETPLEPLKENNDIENDSISEDI